MIRSFFKDSATYVIPVILSRGIGLLLLPVYTRYLSPSDYGLIEMLSIAYAMLNLFLPLEISQAVARFLPEADADRKIRYVSTSFWFTATVFFAFSLLVWFFPVTVGQLLFDRKGFEQVVSLGALAMIANALFYVVQNQLRWNLQSRASAIVSVVFSVVMAAVAVTLVVSFGYGVIGYLFGQLTGSLVALALGLYFSRDEIPLRLRFDPSVLKELLSYSSPLVFSGLAVYLSLYTDRWVLREFYGIEEVGIYGVAYRIASITALGITAFQMAISPLVFRHYREPGTPAAIGNIFSYFLLLTLPLIGLIGAFSAEFISIIATSTFQDADRPAPWLALAAVLMGVYVFAPGLGIAKKTRWIALINIVAAGTNIALNMAWVPVYGAIGAAVATLCGGAVMAGLYFWLGSRFYRVKYRIWRVSLAVTMTVLFLLLMTLNPEFDVRYRALSWLLFSLLILVSQLKPSDWQSLRQ